MKRVIGLSIIFVSTALLYLGIASQWSFQTKWYLDYFNPLAASLRQGRLDIDPPGTTYDLVSYKGKWYLAWGVLGALPFIPLQFLRGQFVPAVYVSIFFASINVCIMYLFLLRLRREFFSRMRNIDILLWLLLFAFGTMNVYVGTLGSVWHVDQIVTSFFGNLGLYVIFKKQRRLRDYMLSSLCFGFALAGRPTIAFLFITSLVLFVTDEIKRIPHSWMSTFFRMAIVYGLPLGIGSLWFFLYNGLRFGHPLEYGYRYITESPYLTALRETYGSISLHYLPVNLWYMLFEIPVLTLENGVRFALNLKGNSILFLTPPFFAGLLTIYRKNIYVVALWLGAIVTMLPSLLIYSTGWMQFGFRYSLDIVMVLLLLALFGMRGRVNVLVFLGIVWAVWVHWMGVTALQ